MATSDNAFLADAKSLNYTFRARAGTKPTWTPRWGFVTDEPHFDPRFKIGAQFGGWFYGVRAYGGHGLEFGGNAETIRGPAVNFYSDFAGVFGTGVYVTGVAGTSVRGPGVYGQMGEDPGSLFSSFPLNAGVLGASASGFGVMGWSSTTGIYGRGLQYIGVSGASRDGVGVQGTAWRDGPAVLGRSANGSGILGISGDLPAPLGVPGVNTSPGVFGTSDRQIGVVGTSNAFVGVYGFSSNYVGVIGQTANPNSVAGYFQGNVAGYFQGNVLVSGNLTVGGVISPNPKLAVMPFPDGTHRALYCMESPEVWFEDFGAARLKRGRTVVKIDADFAKVIKRGYYRVFVTPEGDCRGLYVRRKPTSFEVRELAGGKSNVAFSYRIVGRRKDIGRHTRFAKIDARLAKIDTRLSLPAAATRGAPTAARLRTLLGRLEKQAREITKGGRSPALPKQPPPPLHVRTPRRGKGAIRRRSPNPHIL
jgi:hypothetical protein